MENLLIFLASFYFWEFLSLWVRFSCDRVTSFHTESVRLRELDTPSLPPLEILHRCVSRHQSLVKRYSENIIGRNPSNMTLVSCDRGEFLCKVRTVVLGLTICFLDLARCSRGSIPFTWNLQLLLDFLNLVQTLNSWNLVIFWVNISRGYHSVEAAVANHRRGYFNIFSLIPDENGLLSSPAVFAGTFGRTVIGGISLRLLVPLRCYDHFPWVFKNSILWLTLSLHELAKKLSGAMSEFFQTLNC